MRLHKGTDYHKASHPRYKYVLARQVTAECRRFVGFSVFTKYYNLSPSGILRVQKDFHWDGASGPTIDAFAPESHMRGSLIHDVLYQMLRSGDLSEDVWEYAAHRKLADKQMYDICREDGMPLWRAQGWYWGLRMFGDSSAAPRHF
jgi:hypothetical protein